MHAHVPASRWLLDLALYVEGVFKFDSLFDTCRRRLVLQVKHVEGLRAQLVLRDG